MKHQWPVAVVCRVLGAPRSTVYARRQPTLPARPGPVTSVCDQDLLALIRLVLRASPFAGEGYRKVRARLRREHGVQVSGKRVLRLLRGEPLETLSRELGVEAHRLAAWRDDFLEGGKEALKGQRPDRPGDDRALKQAERKVGQLTMENEILRAAAEKRGLSIPPAKRPR